MRDLVERVALKLCEIYDRQERADGRRGYATTAYKAGSFTVTFWNEMATGAIEASGLADTITRLKAALDYIEALTQREDISDGGKVIFIATKIRSLGGE